MHIPLVQRSSGARALTVALAATLLVSVLGAPAWSVQRPTPAPSVTAFPEQPPAEPPKTATFGIGPATGDKVDGRPDLTFLASPGARARDSVGILNLSDAPLELEVYLSEASNAPDGSIGYGARGDALGDAGRWLTLETPSGSSTVTVRPRETLFVPVVVSVPPDASPGDHLAAVLVSLTASGEGTGSVSQQVRLEQRVATRVFFRVSGELKPQLSIEQLRAEYRAADAPWGRGSAVVTYRVRNTGNAKLKGTGTVTVRGLLGTRSVPGPDVSLLVPGGSVDTTVVVPDVMPALDMSATVELVPVPAAGDVNPGEGKDTATVRFWAIPWLLLGLFLALLLFALAWLLYRRRRGARGQHAAGPAPRDPGRSFARPSRETTSHGATA